MYSLSSGYRRTVTAALLVFVAYAAFVSLGSLEGFPDSLRVDENMPYLADKPVGEDGYYMLTVAWNTAEGDFFSYNYGQNTTGIQPLGTLIYAGLASVVQQFGGDRWSFVRAVVFFGSILQVTFAFLIGRISRSFFSEGNRADAAFILGAGMALLNFNVFRTFTYGLETGFYLIGIALCVLWTLNREYISLTESVFFGSLVGVTGLIRIDFGLIFVVLIIAFLLQRRISIVGSIISGTAALAIVSPWFIWVHHITGNWLPSSGAAQGSMIGEENAFGRLQTMLEAVVNHATPWMYTGSWASLTIVAILSLGVAGIVLYALGSSGSTQVRKDASMTCAAWGIATGLLIAVYPVFFWAGHFYGRYTAPILVALIPGLIVPAVRWVDAEYFSWIRYLVIPGLTICFLVWAGASFHTGRIGNSHAVSAGFIEEQVPSDYKVGAFQSGVIGFYHPNTLNLDGKIDHRALPHLETGTMEKYVDQQEIDVLIDWKGALNRFEEAYLEEHWKPCGPKIPNGMSFCRIRKSLPSLSANQWDRSTEPNVVGFYSCAGCDTTNTNPSPTANQSVSPRISTVATTACACVAP